MAYGSPETTAEEAKVLRAMLENETDPRLLLSWQYAWYLGLKSRPASEFPEYHQQIARDVTRLEAVPAPNDNRRPGLLALGRKLSAASEPR